MKILVCVKQVLESQGIASIDHFEEWVDHAPLSLFRMNRFDEYAVEEALRVRDVVPQVRIDAISVGPQRCESVIRRSMGMGVDRGIHILTQDGAFLSPFETASYIAERAKREQFDLLFAGVMSEDGMNAQVGPMIAELLGIACATSVMHLRITDDGMGAYAEREIERGFRDTLEVRLPAMITVQSGINEPRYPSLSHMLRAGKAPVETIRAGWLTPVRQRERLIRTAAPRSRREGRVLQGTSVEKAQELIDVLRERSLLR